MLLHVREAEDAEMLSKPTSGLLSHARKVEEIRSGLGIVVGAVCCPGAGAEK